jgi:hypothetical protein
MMDHGGHQFKNYSSCERLVSSSFSVLPLQIHNLLRRARGWKSNPMMCSLPTSTSTATLSHPSAASSRLGRCDARCEVC